MSNTYIIYYSIFKGRGNRVCAWGFVPFVLVCPSVLNSLNSLRSPRGGAFAVIDSQCRVFVALHMGHEVVPLTGCSIRRRE